MSDIAIKVEDLGKLYRLGEIGTGTISHDLNRWLARVRGKEDPFSKVGEVNDRTMKGDSDYVWALKDVNFEVKQGEVLGIIGRNGAGKSTLLKILSKVTTPTKGRIKIKGRIASLLEVGTGFHPELTGRENIFLNGAILGMTKAEIRSKFDEIVDFAGVERYIDTPVKRYSSGMYVRLAFAVAAFLEPETLIVDEVLAVGDAEFQKKCLGRMKDVSTNDGRTVLFVSHNMEMISNLCKHVTILENGSVKFNGRTEEGIKLFYQSKMNDLRRVYAKKANTNLPVGFNRIELVNGTPLDDIASDESLKINLEIYSTRNFKNLRIGCRIVSYDSRPVGLFFTDEVISINEHECKTYQVIISNHNLSKGIFSLDFSLGTGNETTLVSDFEIVEQAVSFEVSRSSMQKRNKIAVWNTQNWGFSNYKSVELKLINAL
jgi:lipopolysaccharide transport system ATP-binding protein